MAQVKTLDELKALRDKLKSNILIREASESLDNIRVVVGMSTCGIAAGAKDTFNTLFQETRTLGLSNITLVQSGCIGNCQSEPTVQILVPNKAPVLYGKVTIEAAKEIAQKHLKDGEIVSTYVIG